MRDAPYIDVTFGDQPEFDGHTATVTFIDLDGNVVGTEIATYQAGATVRFAYPGAILDANGNPVDWPVSSPPATPDCDASPPGPPSSTLPATRTGSSRMTVVAAALVVIGLGLVALTRLRAVRK